MDCKDYSPMGTRILIINLDALGDVLRTTSILSPIKRKYNKCHITWLTQKSAMPLLENNHFIDRVLEYSDENSLSLLTERFDVLMCVDKSRRAGALANLVDAKEKFGFGLSETGAIYPFNKEASLLYELGLDDTKKFKVNARSEQDLLAEALGLEYRRDEYILNLTEKEKHFISRHREKAGIRENQTVIGFNTGSSMLYPYKRLNFDSQIDLLKRLCKLFPHEKIVLLGGREDTENNNTIKKKLANKVISTPTDQGLRNGIQFVDLCDIVLTGDTLALHIAIGLKKEIVSFFTISCANEIDLYERGIKVLTDVDCSPCWKSECKKETKCNDKVDLDKLCKGVQTLYSKIKRI